MSSFLYRQRTSLLAAASLSILALGQGQAQAQQLVANTDGGEETVIVTAERHETELSKTPLAVSAILPADLQKDDVEQLADLAGKVPGITLPNAYANMQSIYLRGIGTSDPGVYSAVGIYVDDVYIPRTFGNALFDLPDVQRIEVLRGPQGTLYGQNTSAGAVKIVSRDPTDETVASADARFGSYGQFETHDYLAGNLLENLDGSIAYAHRQTDGYTYNATLNRWVDALDTDQARAKLRWQPNADWDLVLSADGTRDRSDNANVVPLNYPGANPRRTYSNTNTQLQRDNAGTSLNTTYRLSDALTLKSITAFRGFNDHPSPWDMDGTPTDRFGWFQTMNEREFTQEIQALGSYGPLTFTAGAVYFNEGFNFDRFTWQAQNYSDIESHLHVYSGGVYAQGDYQIDDKLSVTAGLRFNDESQHFAAASYKDSAAAYQNQGIVQRLSKTYGVSGLQHRWTALTPKLALNYQATDNQLVYASVTQGQKSGGYNRAAGTLLIASVPVDPEKVTTYEVGSKGQWLDGLLYTSFAAFYNDFKNYQSGVTNPTVNGVLITGNVIVNAAKAYTRGIEFEGTVHPNDALSLNLAVTYLQSEFTSFSNPTGAANTNYAGHVLPFSPNWTIGAGASYILPWELGGQTTLHANLNWLTSTYLDATQNPATRVPSQTYLDLGIDHTIADSGWQLSLLVKNVLDNTYIIGPHFITPSINVNSASYNPPRQITGTIRYNL